MCCALPESLAFQSVVGLVVLAMVGWLLYRSGAKKQTLPIPG